MLCESNRCTGCGACAAICLKDAIAMTMTDEGFYAPEIDETKCVSCGLCSRTCPILKDSAPLRLDAPVAWVAKLRDEAALGKSASGGLFTALARESLHQGGMVFGTIWDEELVARVSVAETEKELAPMRGSKYVQSASQDCYPQVKAALEAGREVLFTGVPCQVAGLYGYLGGKDYPNLITVDIVCHGAGSPGMLRDALKLQGERHGTGVAALDHTDKSRGWSILIQRTIRTAYRDGSESYHDSSEDPYLSLFLNGYIYREGCYQCPGAALPRKADLTLGDFFGFGVAKSHHFDTTGGISQVLINSAKGKELFDAIIQSRAIDAQPCALDECLIFNHNLWKPSPRPAIRDEIMTCYAQKGFETMVQRYYTSPRLARNRRIRRVIKGALGQRGTALGMLIAYRRRYGQRIKQVIKNCGGDPQM